MTRPLYSTVHPMKYLESDVMRYKYILFYSNPSIHCCDNSNKQTRYIKCKKIIRASHYNLRKLPDNNGGYHNSGQDQYDPCNSSSHLSSNAYGCRWSWGWKRTHLFIEEAVFRNELKFKWFELESSGMEWSQVVENEFKWYGMKPSGMDWVQVVWNGFKWHGMKPSGWEWVQVVWNEVKWHGMGSREWCQVACNVFEWYGLSSIWNGFKWYENEVQCLP